MKLVTWNVNSIKARLPRLLELLDEHRPDVACLQETKCSREAFPHAELAAAGYACADHSGGRWAGVAVLGRTGQPPTDVAVGLPATPAAGEQVDDCRWVEATVGGMRVASVYVPNGRAVGTETFAQKLRFLDAMANRVATLADRAGGGRRRSRRRWEGLPLVVAGDMNVAPDDRDVYDPEAFVGSTHVTPDERGRLQRILDAGMVDAYRQRHPDEVCFTWWDYRAGHFHRNLGLRIDLVLLSADLAPRLDSCGIARDYRKGTKPSDHAPLVATLSA
ncbi:MAG: exodeoxyribonuclease III [Egibacteraceae bacterium]